MEYYETTITAETWKAQKAIREEGTWHGGLSGIAVLLLLYGFFWYVGIYEIMGWESGMGSIARREFRDHFYNGNRYMYKRKTNRRALCLGTW